MTKKSTNSIIPLSEVITLNDDQREALKKLGGLRWDIDEIASFFEWDKKTLKRYMDDPDSEISKLLKTGELQARFNIEIRLQEDAADGNLTAAKEYREIMRDRNFKHTKLDLFGAAEKSDIFDTIQRYYEEGRPGDLSSDEQLYLQLLQIIHSFDHQYGKRKTIRILTSEPYSLSYKQAAEHYACAMQMFNSARHTTKEAMKQHIADQYDTIYHSILDTAKTPKDTALAIMALRERARLLGLDKPDEETIDIQQYPKTNRLLSITPENIGLPEVNRDILAAQIDNLEDVSESDKQRLRMEAGVDNLDITKILTNVTQKEN